MRLTASKRVVLVALLLSTAACTAILGTFDTNAEPAVTTEAGPDTASADGNANPVAVDSGILSTCSMWRYPAPVVVDDLSRLSAGKYFTHLQIVPQRVPGQSDIEPSPVRIVTGRENNVAFGVYSLDLSSDSGPPPINTFEQGTRSAVTDAGSIPIGATNTTTIQWVRHGVVANLDNVTTVIGLETITTKTPPSTSESYVAWMLHEEALANDGGGVTQPFTVFPTSPEAGVASLDYIAATPLSDSRLFVTIIDDPGGAAPLFTFAGGSASSGSPAVLSEIATSYVSSDNDPARIVSNNPGSQLDIYAREGTVTYGWSVPPAGSFAAPAKETIGSGSLLDIEPSFNNPPSAAEVAFDRAPENPGLGLLILSGAVPWTTLENGGLSSNTGSGLNVVISLSDNTPNDAGDNATSQGITDLLTPGWYHDQMPLMGHHLLPDGGAGNGVNFAWINASQVRAMQTGVNALLQDTPTTSFIYADAYPASFSASSNTATWDVAWVQRVFDAQGAQQNDVLYFNQLLCQ